MDFAIKIAELTVGVESMFTSTRDYCGKYLSEDAPQVLIQISAEDLLYEQQLLDMEADEEGLKRRRFSGPFLERSFIQRTVANALIQSGTILLHGSTVAVDGNAYLFTAPCGTGKSTHTRLWRETLGDRAVMVNDDKTFLRITDSCVLAYGSPWSGKHGLDTNVCLPLKGICFLERGSDNVIRPADPRERFPELLHQTQMPADGESARIAEDLVARLARSTPLWEMKCTKDPEAAQVAYRAMTGISDE